MGRVGGGDGNKMWTVEGRGDGKVSGWKMELGVNMWVLLEVEGGREIRT
jgi:hypothetical protein